jgi:hypothetical protein
MVRRPEKRSRSFRPLAAIGPAGLGLSRTRERELTLAHAWRGAAGPALAAQARVTLRRGVLEVVAADAAWLAALEPLMPAIAARMARRWPGLELRAWRTDGAARPIRARDAGPSPPPARRLGAPGDEAPPGGDPLERLRLLAARGFRTRDAT